MELKVVLNVHLFNQLFKVMTALNKGTYDYSPKNLCGQINKIQAH